MKKRNDGYVLVLVLVVLVVLCIVAVALLSTSLNKLKSEQATIERMQAKYESQGAIEQVVIKFEEFLGFSNEVTNEDAGTDMFLTEEAAINAAKTAAETAKKDACTDAMILADISETLAFAVPDNSSIQAKVLEPETDYNGYFEGCIEIVATSGSEENQVTVEAIIYFSFKADIEISDTDATYSAEATGETKTENGQTLTEYLLKYSCKYEVNVTDVEITYQSYSTTYGGGVAG